MPVQESNKAKIAKRVIEVLDFFDDSHPTATVMDIVRRYDRPQSSTSELLSTLGGAWAFSTKTTHRGRTR